jgi:predicted RNA-binding Zn-ribbon protein involved in translation (DUF1610 family)
MKINELIPIARKEMNHKQKCPGCGGKTTRRARVDSDDRVEATWLYCYDCGWDQREGPSR